MELCQSMNSGRHLPKCYRIESHNVKSLNVSWRFCMFKKLLMASALFVLSGIGQNQRVQAGNYCGYICEAEPNCPTQGQWQCVASCCNTACGGGYDCFWQCVGEVCG